MSSSRAWQLHGCYKLGTLSDGSMPVDSALLGCEDDGISLDRRDPSHPIRNVIKRMFDLREIYPVLNDGFDLQQLSNQTREIYLPNSNGAPTEKGLWSISRSAFAGVQNLTSVGEGAQGVWLLYTNENHTVDYSTDCIDSTSIIAPFDNGTLVKNLFAPYEEYTLGGGPAQTSGCLSITAFSPGHDARILSSADNGTTVHIKIGFSAEMSCDSISNGLTVMSTVVAGGAANIDPSTVQCTLVAPDTPRWVGEPATSFIYEADLINLHHGVHRLTINNALSSWGFSTSSVDNFMLRVGNSDNPIVFPGIANYSRDLLSEDSSGKLYVSHKASGADLWRYSLDFGTTFSAWAPYTGAQSTLVPGVWSGTKDQAWKGQHVIVQYWSQMAGSSDHYQHGDLDWQSQPPRFYPNLFLEGQFNQHGFDSGLKNKLQLDTDGYWKMDLMTEWPTQVSLNIWGMNPDGKLDTTQVFGDVDGGKSLGLDVGKLAD